MKKTIALLLIFLFSQTAFCQQVVLDPDFHSGFSGFNLSISCIVQQTDGKLLVGGHFTRYNGVFVKNLMRLNADGSLDASFHLPIQIDSNGAIKRIIILPSGKILVLGNAILSRLDSVQYNNGIVEPIETSPQLICLNTDGSFYSGFKNFDGMVRGYIEDIALQTNGKIMVVGSWDNEYYYERYTNGHLHQVSIPKGVIRLNAEGSLDPFFNVGGAGIFNSYGNSIYPISVSVLSNGKYLLGGIFDNYNGYNFSFCNLIQLNSDGSFDNSFHRNFNGGYQITKTIELPDGKLILQCGYLGLVRIFPNGDLDPNFNSAVSFNVNDIYRYSSGKLLVAYAYSAALNQPRGIIQLNENGSYDNAVNFGSGLDLICPINVGACSVATPNVICVQSDNNIVLGGVFTGYNNSPIYQLMRLKACGTSLGNTDTAFACNSYTWQGTTYTNSGEYTSNISLGNGCYRVDTLRLFIHSSIPTSPSITQALVSNTCGARVYRYTASAVANAAGYKWVVPSSAGAVSGVMIDSGNINFSRVIKLRFTSNEAAISGDSIRVRAFSGCGQSALRSAKLINAKLSAPAAPASITITALGATICNQPRYRYTAPALISATTTATFATGYDWSVTGQWQIGVNAVIDSGSLSSQKMIIRYLNGNAKTAGDSIKCRYTSNCGLGTNKTTALTNTKILGPAAPASITVTALGANTCGQPRYRYSAPALPTATTTIMATTGYNWSLLGQWQIGVNAVIDSGSIYSQKLIIRYLNGNVKIAGDSIRCSYTYNCGVGTPKTLSLTNTAVGSTSPAKPASMSIAIVDSTVCGGRKYRYTAPALPASTSVYAAATGYKWTLPITNIGAILDSGTLTSKVIVVKYTNNRAAVIGDSIYLQYASVCGFSSIKSQKLTNLAKANCRTSTMALRSEESLSLNELIVYPNPSNSTFNISLGKTLSENTQLLIFNAEGIVMKKIRVTGMQKINIGEDLFPGVYFLQVTEDGRIIKTSRLIKR